MSLHKKTTKRCLKIQQTLHSEVEIKKYECKYCNKEFLVKRNFEEHENGCKNRDTFKYEQILKEHELLKAANNKLFIDFTICSRSLKEKEEELKETKEKLKEKEEELKTVREELSNFKDEELEKMRKDYKELIDTTSKTSRTVNNNTYNIRINQAFEKLDVLSVENIVPRLTECITTAVVKNGKKSLSNAVNKVLKNKILITDKSRNKAIYKNRDNQMEIETGETVVRKVLKMGSDEILEKCDRAKVEIDCEDDDLFESLRCKQRGNIYEIQSAVIECKNDNKNEVTEYIGKNIEHMA